MLVRFFTDLRAGGVPATLPEFLVLLEGLQARLAALSPENFYYLARAALVKDERHFDRFNQVFARHFAGAEDFFQQLMKELPEEWLRQIGERLFSEDEKARVESLGGWQKLVETLMQRMDCIPAPPPTSTQSQQRAHDGSAQPLSRRPA